jgi:hypothetical protein
MNKINNLILFGCVLLAFPGVCSVGALISLIKRLFRFRHWTIYRPVLLIFRSRNRANLSPSGQDISTNTQYIFYTILYQK